MDNETEAARVDPRQLPKDSFTDSDMARIELVSAAASSARSAERYAQMVGEDEARAGDYVRLAKVHDANNSVLKEAVVAERVRGTSWEILAEVLGVTAEGAEKKWGGEEARWQRATPVTSVYRKNPGYYAAAADKYITTGNPGRIGPAGGRPLSASLDAAAHLTGRDVAAADQAFAGAPVCAHCSR
ncbi:hypothetical protein [Streptomyces sp. CNS654]|uniref:hypothetical protein n=1 Tax=Streptomyces sp. CNS654 TaxID=1506995 RepID=UPI0005162E1B|nr:hypothetical protein [Streptomyces sp. CNS654]